MWNKFHWSPQRRDLTKIIKYGLTAGLTLQALSIITVLGIDEWRKHRNPPSDTFPLSAPHKITVGESEITLFSFGQDVYNSMLADIRSAKKSIYFETFIIKNDTTGKLFRDALVEAAARGVDVYIIIDTWGTLNQPLKVRRYPKMEHLHFQAFPLLRTGLLTGDIRRTGRDHRKLLIVDSKIGYVGGYNIGDLYATKWRDTHIRIAGPDVWELENAFCDFWNDMGAVPAIPESKDRNWNMKVQAVQNRPSKLAFPVRTMYLDAFARARYNIWLTTAYFVPDKEISEFLCKAAQRGVDVKIIIPKYSNHIVVDWISSASYERLLQAGVQIYRFKDAMVHAKTMTVDGKWSTVGTANLDRMSIIGNFEINMALHNEQMAKAMEAAFKTDLTNCEKISLDTWQKRPYLQRLAEKILAPLSPLV